MDISIYGWREEARREVQQRFGVVAREGYGMSETCLKSEGEPWCRLGRIRWPMFGPADWSRHFTPLNEPYWKSLAEGRLTYQRCRSCGHAWLPARSQCPQCLSDDPEWAAASGKARLVSQIVYHHAYHDSVADKLPYTVAVVELDEGPRLTSNVVDSGDPERLSIDQQLIVKIECEGDIFVPRFVAVPRQAAVETTA